MLKTLAATPPVPYGQVAKLARQYYPSFPPAVRASMDLEDLIQSGVARWFQWLPKWKPERGALSTFTHHVVTSWYLEQLRSSKRANRPQELLPFEELHTELLGVRCKHQATAGSHRRMERFFELASADVQELFRRFYFGGEDFSKFGKDTQSQKVREEILWLVARLNLSPDDFRAVRGACLR